MVDTFDTVKLLDIKLGDSYANFKKNVIQEEYNLKLSKDCLKKDFGTINLVDLNTIETGRYIIITQEIPFEVFINNKNSDNLIVFLPGANNPSQRDSIFNRWSWAANNTSISFADPMTTYNGLSLGWFLGTPDLDYNLLATDIVQKITKILHIKNDRIIFYGSSMGGSCSILMASYIPESKSVAINPQISFNIYNPKAVKSIFLKTGLNILEDNYSSRADVSLKLKNRTNRYYLFFNILSDVDMKQLSLLDGIDISSLKYGLNIIDNCCIWLYKAASTITSGGEWSYHNAQDSLALFSLIKGIVDNWSTFKMFDSSFFICLTEIWADRFELYHQLLFKDSVIKAENGDGQSLCVLSDSYLKGISVKYDISKGILYLIRSCKEGYSYAIYKFKNLLTNSALDLSFKKNILLYYTDICSIPDLSNACKDFLYEVLSNSNTSSLLFEQWPHLSNSSRLFIINHYFDNPIPNDTFFEIFDNSYTSYSFDIYYQTGKLIEKKPFGLFNLKYAYKLYKTAISTGGNAPIHDLVRVVWKINELKYDLDLIKLTSNYTIDPFLAVYRARMYVTGRGGVNRDIAKAIDCFSFAYGSGIKYISHEYIATMYNDSLHNWDKEIHAVVMNGEDDDPDCMYWHGVLCIEGRIFDKDYLTGMNYIKMASDKGSVRAKQYLHKKV